MMIFIAQPFAFLVYSSLSLPNAIMIPAPTIARTPRSMIIKTNHLIIEPIIFWNEVIPGCTIHSYLRVSTLLQLLTVSLQVQEAPGISAVVMTVIGPFQSSASCAFCVTISAAWVSFRFIS